MTRLVHTGTKVTVHWALLNEGEDDLGPISGFDFILKRLDDASFEELKSLIYAKQDELKQTLRPAAEPSKAAANAVVLDSFIPTEPPVELVSLNEE